MAISSLIALSDLRIPTETDRTLHLDGKPLSITPRTEGNEKSITPAIGVATVLYNWCPSSLLALLDIENWFSFTWTLTLENESKIEIGRIRNQITFGNLDKGGLWKVMMTFDTLPDGTWLANTEESMLDDKNVNDQEGVTRLATNFVQDLISQRRWLTGKKIRHDFFVESPHIGMDPWEDGMRMNPHWLYESLNLSICTMCSTGNGSMSRCGRCGTAAYCSSACQQKDWPVHKAVCAMSMEDRGKALHYTQHGGLVNWREK